MPLRKIPLKSFILEVTSRCNHRCLYCYNVWKNPTATYPEARESSTGQLKQIIDVLRTETDIRYLAITGGEPLLRSDIPQIIDYCSTWGIAANLLTNGSLLTEALITDCIKAGVSLFEVPLIADDPELHSQLTGSDDFTAVIHNIQKIKQNKGKLITVFVATRHNIQRVRQTVELAIALDADGLMFNRFNAGGAGVNSLAELMPTLTQLKEAITIYDELSGYYGMKASVSVPIPRCLINPKDYRHIRFGYCPSGGQKSYFTIDPGGNVRICNHAPLILGNLFQHSFREIFAHPSIKEFQTACPSKCVPCKQLKNCWGGCKAAALVCTGSPDGADPIFGTEA